MALTQLAKEHSDELVPARKPFDVSGSSSLVSQMIELISWQK